MTIGWLLHWAFAREKVHLARMPGMGEAALFASRAWPRASSTERIGAAVGSSMNLGFEAPPDAYAVLDALASAAGSTISPVAVIVREFALMGVDAHPDWTPKPAIRVVRGKTGYAHEVIRPGKHRLCPFRLFSYTGDLPEVVDERRRVYAFWAECVRRMHAMLSQPDQLAVHALSPDVPSLAPWTG